jgi:hypothetical protein
MKQIVCDCCGEKAKEYGSTNRSEYSILMRGDTSVDLDLCEMCYKSIQRDIAVFTKKNKRAGGK